MEIFIFILVVYGLSNILIFGSIFEPWRNFLRKFGDGPLSLYKLFTCMMCLPTWFGFIISYLMINFGDALTPVSYLGFDSIWLTIFLDGVFASGTTWLVHTIQEYFEK